MLEINRGKSKIVFDPKDNSNQLILQFTGNQTCDKDGNVDPGANFILENVSDEEKQQIATAVIGVSAHFFRVLEANGIRTQFVYEDVSKLQMRVEPGKPIGFGTELIQRYFAYGSLVKRFKCYFKKWQPIDLREFHHKDDDEGDPPMSLDVILAAGILTETEYYEVRDLLGKASAVIRDELARIGLTLIDIKLEVFRDIDGNWMIGDEIAAGNMRVAIDKVEVKDKLLLSHLILNYNLAQAKLA